MQRRCERAVMRSNVSPPQRLEQGGYSEPLAARERGSTSGTLGTLRGCGGTLRSTPRTLRVHQFEPIMSGVRPARYLSESRRRCGTEGGARISPGADVARVWAGMDPAACVCVCVSVCRRVCACVSVCLCLCVCVCVCECVCRGVCRGLLYCSRGYYRYAHAAEPPARKPARGVL